MVAAHNQGLDDAADCFGEINPETRRVRRRSPFMLALEALNASGHSLWTLVSNRLGADYPSETFRVLKNAEQRAFGQYRPRAGWYWQRGMS